MTERVFLHIGAAKTGTSFLQHLLWNNRPALREQEIHLPLRKRRHHLDAVASLRGASWARRPASRSCNDFVIRVHRRRGTAVLSEELLWASEQDHIKPDRGHLVPRRGARSCHGA